MTEDDARVSRLVAKIVAVVIVLAITVTVSGMYGCPKYNVWQKGLAGQAELAQAEYNRKIKVAEAEAFKEAAKSLADAEVIRAEGVAKANKIIGDSLKGNEAYLHYLWIHSLQETKDKVIYIPTEAGLPILEANRDREKK